MKMSHQWTGSSRPNSHSLRPSSTLLCRTSSKSLWACSWSASALVCWQEAPNTCTSRLYGYYLLHTTYTRRTTLLTLCLNASLAPKVAAHQHLGNACHRGPLLRCLLLHRPFCLPARRVCLGALRHPADNQWEMQPFGSGNSHQLYRHGHELCGGLDAGNPARYRGLESTTGQEDQNLHLHHSRHRIHVRCLLVSQ